MAKKVHFLARTTVNGVTNRQIGVGMCRTVGRSLHNYTKDPTKVTCSVCRKALGTMILLPPVASQN